MTSGGSESIILACKAYRNFAREVKGITKPNMVMSVRTFDKTFESLYPPT